MKDSELRKKMYEDEFEIRDFEELENIILPLRENGFNFSISTQDYNKLHPRQRGIWHRLDLSYLHGLIPPEKTPIRKLSETPPDLFKIQKDRKEKFSKESI